MHAPERDGSDAAPRPELEGLLARARSGDRDAEQRLWSLVYDELRELAHNKRVPLQLAGSLQTTALVHETYLRLAGNAQLDFDSLRSFYMAAARAMRNVLIDEIRRARRIKREGAGPRQPLEEALELGDGKGDEYLALDAALDKLEQHDAALSELVHLRYFAGLTVEEVCRISGMSPATYQRHWSYARSWLLREVTRLQNA